MVDLIDFNFFHWLAYVMNVAALEFTEGLLTHSLIHQLHYRAVICVSGPVNLEKDYAVNPKELKSYQTLSQAVLAGKCPLLYGHFSGGKTSHLRCLEHDPAIQKEYVVCYFSLQQSWDFKDRSALTLREHMATALSRKYAISLPLSVCHSFSALMDSMADQLLARTAVPNPKLLLCLDEVDYIREYFPPAWRDFHDFIKFVVDSTPNYRIVCAGTFLLSISTCLPGTLSAGRRPRVGSSASVASSGSPAASGPGPARFFFLSPWSRQDCIEASHFNKDQTVRYLKEVASGMLWHSDVLEDVYSLTGGHPLLVNVCAKVIDDLGAANVNRGEVDMNTWRSNPETYLENAERHAAIKRIISFFKSSFSQFQQAQDLLLELTESGKLMKATVGNPQAIAILRSVGAVMEMGGLYVLTSPMLRSLLMQEVVDRQPRARVGDAISHFSSLNDFISVLLRVNGDIKASFIFDRLAVNRDGIAESSLHHEYYAILRSYLSPRHFTLIPECRTVEGSQVRLDLLLKDGPSCVVFIEFKVYVLTYSGLGKGL